MLEKCAADIKGETGLPIAFFEASLHEMAMAAKGDDPERKQYAAHMRAKVLTTYRILEQRLDGRKRLGYIWGKDVHDQRESFWDETNDLPRPKSTPLVRDFAEIDDMLTVEETIDLHEIRP